jgi:hypothetical protein
LIALWDDRRCANALECVYNVPLRGNWKEENKAIPIILFQTPCEKAPPIPLCDLRDIVIIFHNPHQGEDMDVKLIKEILKAAGISREEWLSA